MRQAWPGVRITLVGLPWAKDFVARFARYLDSFQEFPGFDGLPERGFDPARMRAFVARGSTFDLAIQLHGDGSVTNRFLPRLRARLTAGFFPPGQPCPDPARFIPYPDNEHEIRRLLKLVRHLGIPWAGENLEFPLTHDDYHEANRVASAAGLRGDYVCLHPGARDPGRRWPLENFLQVGEALAASGRCIVLTGTAEEADQTAALRARLGDSCVDLAGRTSLGALGALLKKARLLISNDTGISHLAAALGVPSVTIFSASDRRRWAPLDTNRHRALGDPFVSPAVHATPAAVLGEAFSLLDESPLRLEARGGGFPVLPPVNWSRVKRVLLVSEGAEADTLLLAPCVSALHSGWPALALLTSPAGARAAALFPGIDRLLVAEQESLVEPVAEGAVLKLVNQLRACSFDASIIFTPPGRNPYTTAYICYLAGIPIRIAASKEFGGSLLSHWVRKLSETLDPTERHLALLRAVALPSRPQGEGLCIPADVEGGVKAELRRTRADAANGFLLLADAGAGNGGVDTFAEQLRDLTGIRVMHRTSLGSGSLVEFAALVRLSELVITACPVTSRIADAFGRPLIATGEATTPSDGWRPRRSFSKLIVEPDVSQEQVLQAVRTLLWLRGSWERGAAGFQPAGRMPALPEDQRFL